MNNIVLIATVVAYINKEGDEVGPFVCPTLENPDLVPKKAGYFQGLIHSKLAECGSRQAIQARPDHPNRVVSPPREVFQSIGNRWYQPQIDLFRTRFNNKLTQFVSSVPDPLAKTVDVLSLSWEDLNSYAFPPGDPLVPAQPAHSAIQSDSSQESVKSKSTCLACNCQLPIG